MTMMIAFLLLTFVLSLAATCNGFVVLVGSFSSQQQLSGNRRVALSFFSSEKYGKVEASSSSLYQSTKETSSSSSSSTAPSSAADEAAQRTTKKLEAEQLDFVLGYLNKHHESTLKKFAAAYSPLGQEMAKMNTWSGGSMELRSAKITDIDTSHIELSVQVERRGKVAATESVVSFPLDTNVLTGRAKFKDLPLVEYDDDRRLPIDDIVRRLNRLCWMVQEEHVTGKLIQLAMQLGGAAIGKIPDSLYLNQVPHNVYVRNYFYTSASKAVKDAVIACSSKAGKRKMTNRMQVISQFPEMNPSMDSYRIGTILEMCRDMCITLAEENVRVRLCVQGSMGVGIFTGVPKQLSGVSKLIQMMDWQSGEGQENEGMVGNYVNFGNVGAQHVKNEIRDETTGNITQYQDDVFIIIAPQSMVGTDSSIIPDLLAMVDAAGDRPVILINPDLTDKISAAGQQSVRGRQERIDFANSFETIWQFQNIYVSGTSYFPILGAITKLHPTEPWVAHQRRDYANGAGEVYVPVLSGETKPTGEAILANFER